LLRPVSFLFLSATSWRSVVRLIAYWSAIACLPLGDQSGNGHFLVVCESAIGRRPLTTSGDESAIGRRPLTTSDDESAIGRRPLTTSDDESAIGRRPLTTSAFIFDCWWLPVVVDAALTTSLRPKPVGDCQQPPADHLRLSADRQQPAADLRNIWSAAGRQPVLSSV
jgi:hypothetical protein